MTCPGLFRDTAAETGRMQGQQAARQVWDSRQVAPCGAGAAAHTLVCCASDRARSGLDRVLHKGAPPPALSLDLSLYRARWWTAWCEERGPTQAGSGPRSSAPSWSPPLVALACGNTCAVGTWHGYQVLPTCRCFLLALELNSAAQPPG